MSDDLVFVVRKRLTASRDRMYAASEDATQARLMDIRGKLLSQQTMRMGRSGEARGTGSRMLVVRTRHNWHPCRLRWSRAWRQRRRSTRLWLRGTLRFYRSLIDFTCFNDAWRRSSRRPFVPMYQSVPATMLTGTSYESDRRRLCFQYEHRQVVLCFSPA